MNNIAIFKTSFDETFQATIEGENLYETPTVGYCTRLHKESHMLCSTVRRTPVLYSTM